jgi:hypothetical protein
MPHYEFLYAIEMAWFGVKTKSDSSLTSGKKQLYNDFSTVTPNTAANSLKRAKHINDNSLEPVTGSLWERLGADFHYIVPSNAKEPVCSLCRRANTTTDKD